MKKVLSLVALAMISTIMFAVNDGVKADQNKKEAKSGEVIVMNKEMFINDVLALAAINRNMQNTCWHF